MQHNIDEEITIDQDRGTVIPPHTTPAAGGRQSAGKRWWQRCWPYCGGKFRQYLFSNQTKGFGLKDSFAEKYFLFEKLLPA